MLRQAQHERKIHNDFSTRPVRPEPVEGRMRVFSLHLKKDSYIISKSQIPITENDRLIAVLEYNDFLGNCYSIAYKNRQHSEPIRLEQRKIPFKKMLKI